MMNEPKKGSEAAPVWSSEQQPTICRPIQDALGERLRSMYDTIKAEPVPDRLLALLQQMDKRSSKE